MAPGVAEMLQELPLRRQQRRVIDVPPIAFVQLQCIGFGDLGVVTELPGDQTQLRVVADADGCGLRIRVHVHAHAQRRDDIQVGAHRH